ncbi:hypothetical protein AUP07_0760 [methanogenic archaeon mixed culture ISO4-G1]|nr:hypothetical protein AUP07_0760 [methanogenic archaeon mixed culture ISO4-G1]
MHNGVRTLFDEYHNLPEPNNNRYSEFDNVPESTTQRYRNFDYIDEYHNNYDDMPMAGHSNSTQDQEDLKDLNKELNGSQSAQDTSSAQATSGSSAASSTSATVTTASSASTVASTAASASASAVSVSASTVIASSFVAMVAVAAVVVPAIANVDVQVYLDASFSEGYLTYSIELVDAVEDEAYFACVYENGSLVYKEQIIDNQQSNSIPGLNGYRDHTVDVRAGEMTLLVLKSVEIPGMPVWAELLTTEPDYDSIYFSVFLHGDDETGYVAMYDAVTGTVVYQSPLTTGRLAETVTGLEESHTYTIKVWSETESYLSVDVSTLSPSVDLDHLTVTSDSIEYGVTIQGLQKPTTLDLYDPETSASVYSVSVVNGYNEGVITGLSSKHTYVLTVSSETATYYSSEITTAASEVNLDSVTPVLNTIEYTVTVTGVITDALLDLTDPETSTSVYSIALTEGTNTATITELLYNHTYVLSASSGTETYFSQEVTTEGPAISVELESLTAEENTISYSVTVTGSGQTVTLYLMDSGTAVYTLELVEGSNTGTIEDLEYEHEYQLVVSTEDETFVEETISTEEDPVVPTTVTVNYIRGKGAAIEYSITVEGNTDTPVLTVTNHYDTNRSVDLTVGLNEGTIDDLSYQTEYDVTISGNESYYSDSVETENTIEYDLSQVGKTIHYSVTINDTVENTTIYVKDADDSSVTLTTISVSERITTGVLDEDWIIYGHRYDFGVLHGSSDTGWYGHITVNNVSVEIQNVSIETGIVVKVTVNNGDYNGMSIRLLDETREGELGTTNLTAASATYTFTENISGHYEYYIAIVQGGVMVDDYVQVTGTDIDWDVLETFGNTVNYDFTVTGDTDSATLYIKTADGGDILASVDLHQNPQGTITSASLEYNTQYYWEVRGEYLQYPSMYGNIWTQPLASVNVYKLDSATIYDVTINSDDLEDLSFMLFTDSGRTSPVSMDPIPITSSFTRIPVALVGQYWSGIMSGGDVMPTNDNTETFYIDASIAGSTLTASTDVYEINTSGMTIGLYTDPECQNLVPGTKQSLPESAQQEEVYEVEFTITDFTTDVYVGLLVEIDSQDYVLATELVETGFVCDMFGLDGDDMKYSVTLHRNYSGNLVLYWDNDSVLTVPLSTIPSGDPSVTMTGTYEPWDRDQSYTLKIEIDGQDPKQLGSITVASYTDLYTSVVGSTIAYNGSTYDDGEFTIFLYSEDTPGTYTLVSSEALVLTDRSFSGQFEDLQSRLYLIVINETGAATPYIHTYAKKTQDIRADDEWDEPGSASKEYGQPVVTSGTLVSGLTPVFGYFSDPDRTIGILDLDELDIGTTVYVKVTTEGNAQYKAFSDSTISFSISKMEDSWATTPSASKVYGQNVVTSGTLTSGLTPVFSYFTDEGRTDDINDLDTIETRQTVYVKVTTAGNTRYNAFTDDTISFVIQKADDEWVSAPSASKVYGEPVQTSGTLKSGIARTFSYYNDPAREDPIGDLASVNAETTVYVKITSAGNDDYNAFTDTSLSFVIQQADDYWTTSASVSKVYGQPVQTSGTLKSGLTPTFSYYSDSGRTNEYTMSQLNALSAGSTVYVKVTTEGNTNYKPMSGSTISFVVAVADDTVSVTMSGYTYGQSETPSAPNVTKNTTGATTLYYSTVGTYTADNVASNATAWPATLTSTSIDAGTYYVYAVTAADTNYNAGFAVSGSTFTVSKAVDSWTTTPSASKVYRQDVVIDGTLASRITPTFSYFTNEARSVPVDNIVTVNAGQTIYVKATTTGNENYNAFTDITTISFVVQKADDTVSVSMTGYTYGQSTTPSAPSVTKNTTGATTLYYSTVGTYTADNVASNATVWPTTLTSTSIDAGTYYVYAVTAADTNYNAGFAVSGSTFTVSKAVDSWTVPGSVSKVEGYSVSTSGTLKSRLTPSFSYYSDNGRTNELTTQQLNALSAGETVYVKVTTGGNTNYEPFTDDSTISFTVQEFVTFGSASVSDGTLHVPITFNVSYLSDFTIQLYRGDSMLQYYNGENLSQEYDMAYSTGVTGGETLTIKILKGGVEKKTYDFIVPS